MTTRIPIPTRILIRMPDGSGPPSSFRQSNGSMETSMREHLNSMLWYAAGFATAAALFALLLAWGGVHPFGSVAL